MKGATEVLQGTGAPERRWGWERETKNVETLLTTVQGFKVFKVLKEEEEGKGEREGVKTLKLRFLGFNFLKEGGGGEGGSPRLCQGLLFVVLALVDIPSTVKIII